MAMIVECDLGAKRAVRATSELARNLSTGKINRKTIMLDLIKRWIRRF